MRGENVASRNPTAEISRILAKVKVAPGLLLGVEAGAATYVLGGAIAAIIGTSGPSLSQDDTSTMIAHTTLHSCALTSK